MQKTFVKKNKEWTYWELASVTMAESPQASLACCGCDDTSVLAKDATRNGWIRAVWMAVKDLGQATSAYESIGLPLGKEVEIARMGAKGREVIAGESSILLLERKDPKGVVAASLDVSGEGIVGISIEVGDLAAARALIEKQTNFKLPEYDGVFGRSFLVPAGLTHGVWLEFFQAG